MMSNVTTAPTTNAPTLSPPAAAARLRFVITRLHRLLRQHSTGELTLTQASTLATVRNHGPLTLGELASVEQVARPTITNVVDKLEARGFVQRTIDAADRRVCRVSITDAGEHHLAEIREQRTAWLSSRLEGLDPSDLARITDALDLLEQLATDPGAP
jgi:DNA-binding MarR family transcriptional regulator